jgi:hypothetical protein
MYDPYQELSMAKGRCWQGNFDGNVGKNVNTCFVKCLEIWYTTDELKEMSGVEYGLAEKVYYQAVK